MSTPARCPRHQVLDLADERGWTIGRGSRSLADLQLERGGITIDVEFSSGAGPVTAITQHGPGSTLLAIADPAAPDFQLELLLDMLRADLGAAS